MINDYDRFAKERQEQLKKGEKRPSFHFKKLKKSGFVIEDFSEGICTDECKDIDYNYWNKYHEIPQFMAFLATKKEAKIMDERRQYGYK